MSDLGEWQNSCVIVGAAAGALASLQFALLALIASRARVRMPI
jgi:hypothetical protein